MYGFSRRADLDDRTHALAEWLRANGWNETWENRSTSQFYYNGAGTVIAILTYWGHGNTRFRVWTRD